MAKLTGTNPDQVPTNADLGTMAYQDTNLFTMQQDTNGDFIVFRQGGTEAGVVSSSGGSLLVGEGSAGIKFNSGSTKIIPRGTNNQNVDGTIDLGGNGDAWKDLYLSGGVYLGGTGAANKLDDYEEGTWTPAVAAGSISGTSITYTGTYRKIGSIVLIGFQASNTTGDISVSSYVAFSGLPFACNMTATSTVTTEDIDQFDRQGFAQMGSSTLTLSNCGSTSGTTSLSVSIVGHTA